MQQRLYFPSVDGLRFLAILFVFLHHFDTFIPSRFFHQIGWIGVQLFFLISAFLLTKLLKEEYNQQGKVNLKFFYGRRILRIWPLYFFYLTVVTIYGLTVGAHYFSENRLIGNIFFADNILSAVGQYNTNPFTIHLWSLSMEEQYYLFLPFIVPWLLRQNKKNAVLIFVILFILLITGRVLSVRYGHPHHFIYVLPLSGDCFLAGMILGLGLFDRIAGKMNSLLCFAGAILLLLIIYILGDKLFKDYHQWYSYSIVALASLLLLISVTFQPAKILSLLFANRLVRYLGKISFGLYVYHIISIYGAGRICEKLQINPEQYHLPLSLSATFVLSVLSYEFFEKPILHHKKRITLIKNREL